MLFYSKECLLTQDSISSSVPRSTNSIWRLREFGADLPLNVTSAFSKRFVSRPLLTCSMLGPNSFSWLK